MYLDGFCYGAMMYGVRMIRVQVKIGDMFGFAEAN